MSDFKTNNSKRKALIKTKGLPFSGREAQRIIAKHEMLERIGKMKQKMKRR